MASKKNKRTNSRKPDTKLNPLHYVELLVIPFFIFGRILFFDYVMHDDDKMILENPVLEQGFNPGVAFTTDAWFMDARIELYRPWQSITYMVDYALGGESAVIYHLHNLFAYLAGVFLLFIFLSYYFRPILAWAGALLYSVNLLVPHVTGWIAARGDLYLMVFGLAFLICIQRYLKSGKASSLWLGVPAFALALFSKESAVALLPIAVIMLFIERGKMLKGMEWGWLVANAVVFAGYFAMRQDAIADAGNLSPAAFFSNLRSLPEELFKMLFPLGFSVMPGYKVWLTAAGVAVTGLLIYLVMKYKPSKRLLWVGLAILLLPLLPSMVYEPSFAGVAYDYLDHRTWFPFVGVWLIILSLIQVRQIDTSKTGNVLFFSVLIAWGTINLWQIGKYQGWEPYYTNAIATNPNSGLANLNYGSMLRDRGDWEGALPYVEKGVTLSPDYIDAKVRLAEVYYALKRYPDAVRLSDQVLEKEPDNIQAYQFKGSALGASGQPGPALEVFRRVLELQPENPHGIFNLAIAYKDMNQLDKAVEYLTKLLEIKPDFPNAYYERGFCYGKMGLMPQAKADMEKSIEIQPEHGPSWYFRGRTKEAQGDIPGACADWRKALELGTPEAEPFVQRCNQAGAGQ
jgi:tetratricopeptide (TPR) repeat protein